MILRQQHRAIGHPRAFGHVSLLAPNLGQCLRALCNRSPRGTEPRAIFVDLAARSLPQQLVHPRLAERRAHRSNDLHRQVAMRVGQALSRSAGQSPSARRPTHLAPFIAEFDECFHLESIEMLAHGHSSDAKAARNLRRSLRASSLKLEEDALLRTRVMLHEMRWYRPGI